MVLNAQELKAALASAYNMDRHQAARIADEAGTYGSTTFVTERRSNYDGSFEEGWRVRVECDQDARFNVVIEVHETTDENGNVVEATDSGLPGESWEPGDHVIDARNERWVRRDNRKHPWYHQNSDTDYPESWPVRPLTRVYEDAR